MNFTQALFACTVLVILVTLSIQSALPDNGDDDGCDDNVPICKGECKKGGEWGECWPQVSEPGMGCECLVDYLKTPLSFLRKSRNATRTALDLLERRYADQRQLELTP